ncbi:MAG: dicarboxylate/amino acid:cation symporter [Longimicrobiales bacterium]|nr:dicarboxylate/amino acid:cation symporter [Longimicrobiales bacterium]
MTSKTRLGLGARILLGMAVGTVLGVVFGERATVIEPVGGLFIRLLVLAAVPLVFFNLLAGVTTLTDLRTLGRLTGKILSWFFATKVVALLLGIGAMMVLRPGVGMTLRGEAGAEAGEAPSVVQVLLDLVPTNAFRAFADGNVVQVVVLAVMLGVATLLVPVGPRDRLRGTFADLAELLRKVVDLILRVAPYGIGALMAVTVGRYGAELFGPMAGFVAGVTGAHLLMIFLYMVLLRLFSSRRPLVFLRETGAIWATTVATTSSLATLPVALEVSEKIGLPRSVYGFTLPLGAQINKDGTAVMLAAVVVLTAQAAGVALSTGDLVTIVLMGFLLSAGSGGIPGGGFVVALIMVGAFNLPLELATIVGGIYRLIDMGNTTVNVMGSLVGTVLVAESEEVSLPTQ